MLTLLFIFFLRVSLPSVFFEHGLKISLHFELKVLGYYHSKDHPRESSSKALKLDLEAVRPDPLIPLEEYRYVLCFI